MINDLVKKSDYPTGKNLKVTLKDIEKRDINAIAKLISACENYPEEVKGLMTELKKRSRKSPVLGITGTGGSGKSSIVDEIVRRYLSEFPDKTIAILSVDPSKRKTVEHCLGTGSG